MANSAKVQHVLISWAELAKSEREADPRAAGRSKRDAEQDMLMVKAKAQEGIDFAELMRDYSEDPGSAASGKAYDVTPDAGLVLQFKQLALRLNVGEIGVCESAFGFHLMRRTE